MCILTMQSMTYALRAKSVLEVRGITVSIVNLDPTLTREGCAYGIRFPCVYGEQIRTALKAKNVPFGILIGGKENRTP